MHIQMNEREGVYHRILQLSCLNCWLARVANMNHILLLTARLCQHRIARLHCFNMPFKNDVSTVICSATALSPNLQLGGLPCLYRLVHTVFHAPTRQARGCSTATGGTTVQQCNSTGLNLADMPPYIILIRHGEVSKYSSYTHHGQAVRAACTE